MKKKSTIKKIIILSFFLIGNIIFHNTYASGLSIKPAELTLEGVKNEEIEGRLLVTNLGDDVTIFEAYPDLSESSIKIMPASFVLESKEKKEIFLKITKKENGLFQETISIINRPLKKDEFSAGSGIKIPVKIIINEKYSKLLASIASLKNGYEFGVLLSAFLLFLFFISTNCVIKEFKKVKINE